MRIPTVNGDTSPSQCKQEKDLLVKNCKAVILVVIHLQAVVSELGLLMWSVFALW
ncbi:hypothetical protein FEM48_Zijuj03G0122800 [Ziziphus jujuba var. spinosa]|uniref:Uncharacterized protein n=1 Tax=Ziziphus jujuba var. spinosa TaxID=714518 RepID=A0A978VQ94_ZIZJJ|nr:hypothetical protein FEM48_Zijuj03G0122800 [Ziziphus jujuba var. spinosa]